MKLSSIDTNYNINQFCNIENCLTQQLMVFE